MVGRRPIMPTTAVITVSAEGSSAASTRPSMPAATRVLVSASRTFKSAAAFSSIITASSGWNCRTCSSMRSTLALAVKAPTVMPQAAITSSDCRPMDPVEPKIEMRLLIRTLLSLLFLKEKKQKNFGAKLRFAFLGYLAGTDSDPTRKLSCHRKSNRPLNSEQKLDPQRRNAVSQKVSLPTFFSKESRSEGGAQLH